MPVILGIDPGSRCTGYGLIHSQGSKQTYLHSGYVRLTADQTAARLHTIYACISELIQHYGVQEMAIEQIFIHVNPGSALKLGQARGAAMVAGGQAQLTVAEYTARQIKQSVVGYGAADKTQMQRMVQTLLRLPALPQTDEADALATALCHAHFRQGLTGLLAGRSRRRGRSR